MSSKMKQNTKGSKQEKSGNLRGTSPSQMVRSNKRLDIQMPAELVWFEAFKETFSNLRCSMREKPLDCSLKIYVSYWKTTVEHIFYLPHVVLGFGRITLEV